MGKISLKTKVYQQVKNDILNLKYLPGTMINEESIKATYGVSRTPIREALGVLEGEGLVTIKPKKGILISPLNIDEVNQVFEVRILIEPYVLKNYGNIISQEKILEFYTRLSACDPKDEKTSFMLDSEFHSIVMEALGNTYLRQFYEGIREKNYRLMILTGKKDHRIEETLKEHLDIIKACLIRDWNAAAEAMTFHLLAAKKSTFELLFNTNKFDFSS